LIECGFISNKIEFGNIRTKDYRQRLAGGIARGIHDFLDEVKEDPLFGVTLIEPEPQIEPGEMPVADPPAGSAKPKPASATL
jgi:hypothetical protein